MDKFVPKWNNFSPAPPATRAFEIASLSPDSHPGPDGVFYSAWGASPKHAGSTLFRVSLEMARGVCLPLDFNGNIGAFGHKGNKPGDHDELIREPMETRPLGMRNIGNKIIGSAFNSSIKCPLGLVLHKAQRCFTHLRQLLQNVGDLDSVGRIFGLASGDALLALFDINAAFPSLLWDWMFAVLEARGFTPGFTNVVKGLYSMAFTVVTIPLPVCSYTGSPLGSSKAAHSVDHCLPFLPTPLPIPFAGWTRGGPRAPASALMTWALPCVTSSP